MKLFLLLTAALVAAADADCKLNEDELKISGKRLFGCLRKGIKTDLGTACSHNAENTPKKRALKKCAEIEKDLTDCDWKGCDPLAVIDGEFSDWSNFTDCSAPCGPGKMDRERTCSEPAPRNGGADCVGDAEESVECELEPCQVQIITIDPPKPIVEPVVQPLPVGPEVQPLPVGPEVQPLPVGPQVQPLPVGPQVQPLPVGPEVQPLPVGPEVQPAVPSPIYGITATMDTKYANYKASNAVDGMWETKASSKCGGNKDRWIKLDLHGLYAIGNVKIIQSKDNEYRMRMNKAVLKAGSTICGVLKIDFLNKAQEYRIDCGGAVASELELRVGPEEGDRYNTEPCIHVREIEVEGERVVAQP